MGNTKTKKKKILILTFEDYYTKKMYSNISQRELTDELENGFITDNVDYNNIEFSVWYLSSKNRHLWKHHFIATQGIVIVFSFRDEKTDKGVIYEALRIFLVGNPKKVVPVIVCNLAVFEERVKIYRLYVKFIE